MAQTGAFNRLTHPRTARKILSSDVGGGAWAGQWPLGERWRPWAEWVHTHVWFSNNLFLKDRIYKQGHSEKKLLGKLLTIIGLALFSFNFEWNYQLSYVLCKGCHGYGRGSLKVANDVICQNYPYIKCGGVCNFSLIDYMCIRWGWFFFFFLTSQILILHRLVFCQYPH